MKSQFINSICATGLLSFNPESKPIPLTPLNVLIGPNGAGKSNLIELFELLKAVPTDLASVIREGGGVEEWLWKGRSSTKHATIDATIQLPTVTNKLRYRLQFAASTQRIEVIDEAIEETAPRNTWQPDVYFYYRFQKGHPAINVRRGDTGVDERKLNRDSLDPQQSVLSQRKDPDLYPEVTALGQAFSQIGIFRDWSFGRNVALRQSQPADLPDDILLPDARNLGLVLNAIEHSSAWPQLKEAIQRFLPRFERLTTRVQAGNVQIFLHEVGLKTPMPATRLSDGTIRFLALLAILLRPEAAPLICIEEPELGMHPDGVSLLSDLLVEASKKTQLIITTHSDALISALTEHVESVVVCEHVGGGSDFKRLDSAKLQFWLDKYRLGEIWRIGEIGGNP